MFDFVCVGGDFVGQYFDDCGFVCVIGVDKGYVVVVQYMQIEGLQDGVFVKVFVDVFGVDYLFV